MTATDVTALRRAFDATFQEAPAPPSPPAVDYLEVRVGRDPYLIRLEDIGGLFRDLVLVPVPSAAPGLLGVAGLRGAIVPVWDLARVTSGTPAARPRWFVLVRRPRTWALAFDAFVAHRRLPRAETPSIPILPVTTLVPQKAT